MDTTSEVCFCQLKQQSDQEPVFLEDGKNKWKENKIQNLDLSKVYNYMHITQNNEYYQRRATRSLDCATFLTFKEYQDGQMKLHTANLCKLRLCPTCSWRRSLKVYGQVSQVIDAIEKQNEYGYIFVTLTIKNCVSEDLHSTIDQLLYGFNKLMKRKPLGFVHGYFRALETTYNKKLESWHPHLHMICVVNKSYFKSRDYLSQVKLAEIWQSCLDIDYTPVVDVRKIKKMNHKTVAETTKYTVKSNDFLIRQKNGKVNINESAHLVYVLDKALAGRRLYAYGGIMKTIHHALNLEDAENSDLLKLDSGDEEMREDIFTLVCYTWNRKHTNYIKRT